MERLLHPNISANLRWLYPSRLSSLIASFCSSDNFLRKSNLVPAISIFSLLYGINVCFRIVKIRAEGVKIYPLSARTLQIMTNYKMSKSISHKLFFPFHFNGVYIYFSLSKCCSLFILLNPTIIDLFPVIKQPYSCPKSIIASLYSFFWG